MQLSCSKTFTKASSTEPGRELRLRERIVKIGTWDDLENITEIEPGRELHDENHADSCRLALDIVSTQSTPTSIAA